jgi:lysophospholipase L1-like esterase
LFLALLFACRPDPEPALSVRDRCFPGIGDPSLMMPEYDRFEPTVGAHCAGTAHQQIDGVERVVFVGDSVTKGTPPTDEDDFFRTLVAEGLEERFPGVEVADCSAWGAETHDLHGPDGQLEACFDDVNPERTLVIGTIGGNDMFEVATRMHEGETLEQLVPRLDQSLGDIEQLFAWLADADRFPAGAQVVLANAYEFTDATGDLASCPTAEFFGYDFQVPAMRDAYVHLDEGYLELAVEYRVDVMFLLEHFCGHGFFSDDPTNECYRGPETPRWFDGTCIHPNPDGHAAIAELFLQVVDGDPPAG